MTYQTNSPNLETTERLGALVGARLRGGEVIALNSDLGGGKTAFVRGLAKGLGSKDHVSSPTFTLTREYRALKTGLTLYHFDFYRLAEPGLVALELQEMMGDPAAILVVEWGDIVQGVLPEKRLDILFTRVGENARTLSFQYTENLAYMMAEITKDAQLVDAIEDPE